MHQSSKVPTSTADSLQSATPDELIPDAPTPESSSPGSQPSDASPVAVPSPHPPSLRPSESPKPYPRTTALDFLARCRPLTAAFYRYWDSKRRGRKMPARADIDPLEMKPWLTGVALVEVLRNPDAAQHAADRSKPPYELRYRLVGSRPTLLRGQEVTGMPVRIGYYGASLDAAMENYRLVIEERKLVFDWDHTPSPDGFAKEGETLLLPLSSDGETVDMVLVYQEVDTL